MAMDSQAIQQLTQVFQQGLQILQSMGGSSADDMNQASNADMPDNGDYDDDDDMGNDDDTPDADMSGSLHDRVSSLEQHTGLKKSAGNLPLVHRIDALEDHWLGEQYEGSANDRVAQLETVALRKSATPEKVTEDEAPETIDLGALIKTAVAEGAKEAVRLYREQEAAQDDDDELPSVAGLRKAAKSPTIATRKAQPPSIQTDDQLSKAAKQWGYSDAELDKPVGLGDYLLAQYRLGNNSGAIEYDAD